MFRIFFAISLALVIAATNAHADERDNQYLYKDALYKSCKELLKDENGKEGLLCHTTIQIGVGATLNTMAVFYIGDPSRKLSKPQAEAAYKRMADWILCDKGASPAMIWDGPQHTPIVAKALIQAIENDPQLELDGLFTPAFYKCDDNLVNTRDMEYVKREMNKALRVESSEEYN